MDNKELISSDPDSDPFILSNNVELVMNTIQDQRNLKPYNLKECCVALTRLNSDFLIEYFSKYQEQKNLNYSLLNMFVEEIMDNQIIMDDFKDKNQIMNDMNEKELENSLVDQFIHILDNQKCQSDQKYNINIKQDLIKQIDDYLLTKPSIEMVKPEHDTHNAIPEKYLKLLKTKLSKTTLIRKNPDMPLKKFKSSKPKAIEIVPKNKKCAIYSSDSSDNNDKNHIKIEKVNHDENQIQLSNDKNQIANENKIVPIDIVDPSSLLGTLVASKHPALHSDVSTDTLPSLIECPLSKNEFNEKKFLEAERVEYNNFNDSNDPVSSGEEFLVLNTKSTKRLAHKITTKSSLKIQEFKKRLRNKNDVNNIDSSDEIITKDLIESSLSQSDNEISALKRTRSSVKKFKKVQLLSDKCHSANNRKSEKGGKKDIQLDTSDKELEVMNSNEGEEESDTNESRIAKNVRKNIRKIKSMTQLKMETREAAKSEQARLKRISENRISKMKQILEEEELKKLADNLIKELVLELPDQDGTGISLKVDPTIVQHLKPHQVKGITFLYENVIESWKRFKNGTDEGNGAILAHLMGLGKSLQIITLVHTLLSNTHFKTHIKTCLIICPQNTCINWMNEMGKWTSQANDPLLYWGLFNVRDKKSRKGMLKNWHSTGGILIIGYDLFRTMISTKTKSSTYTNIVNGTLLDPGPDILVCDEGHLLKNSSTALFKAVNKIRTRRRIVLTGTPLQNNLYEYHCMVQLVRPSILGSKTEFQNMFVNPIRNGQCADSTERDVKIMKKRAHILHQKLSGIIQRMDYTTLKNDQLSNNTFEIDALTPKYEYIVYVRLSHKQIQMYKHYLQSSLEHNNSTSSANDNLMENTHKRSKKVGQTLTENGESEDENMIISANISGNKFSIFICYQELYNIIVHPWLCPMMEARREAARISKDYSDNEETDEEVLGKDSSSESSMQTISSEESLEYISEGDLSNLGNHKRRKKSNKNQSKLIDDDFPPSTRRLTRNTYKNTNPVQNEKIELPEDGTTSSTTLKNFTGDEKWFDQEEHWWNKYLSQSDALNVCLGGKIVLLLEILKESEAIGDKVLLFTQSLTTLDYLEKILSYINKSLDETLSKDEIPDLNPKAKNILTKGWTYKTWIKGLDYFRMDGSTSINSRFQSTQSFNDLDDMRARFYMISTKAGSLGVNLIGASRIVLMDACWNPTHDTQSIFRAYRLGQTKSVFIYRLIAQGTMEERIYERQVTKQSLSQRVVDKKQIARHFTFENLRELYSFEPDLDQDNEREEEVGLENKTRERNVDKIIDTDIIVEDGVVRTNNESKFENFMNSEKGAVTGFNDILNAEDRVIVKKYPMAPIPKDHILAQLLLDQKRWIVTYRDHDSLLENKESEELTEEERRLAWEEYETERYANVHTANLSNTSNLLPNPSLNTIYNNLDIYNDLNSSSYNNYHFNQDNFNLNLSSSLHHSIMTDKNPISIVSGASNTQGMSYQPLDSSNRMQEIRGVSWTIGDDVRIESENNEETCVYRMSYDNLRHLFKSNGDINSSYMVKYMKHIETDYNAESLNFKTRFIKLYQFLKINRNYLMRMCAESADKIIEITVDANINNHSRKSTISSLNSQSHNSTNFPIPYSSSSSPAFVKNYVSNFNNENKRTDFLIASQNMRLITPSLRHNNLSNLNLLQNMAGVDRSLFNSSLRNSNNNPLSVSSIYNENIPIQPNDPTCPVNLNLGSGNLGRNLDFTSFISNMRSNVNRFMPSSNDNNSSTSMGNTFGVQTSDFTNYVNMRNNGNRLPTSNVINPISSLSKNTLGQIPDFAGSYSNMRNNANRFILPAPIVNSSISLNNKAIGQPPNFSSYLFNNIRMNPSILPSSSVNPSITLNNTAGHAQDFTASYLHNMTNTNNENSNPLLSLNVNNPTLPISNPPARGFRVINGEIFPL
ncbi:transcriptional regulator ATRX-like isoform X2 [Gordionus sp. m RMFG-2023]|uniref:transcriptional regulator ATRX-like isoform X2 n=1 Tax=Gordionus sp. m RMFG-2023 TaxID=3053472 RepID=UPI0031FBDDCC